MPITQDQATGRFVDAGGIRIHYGDVGSGPPLVLLHGAGPGADAWGNFQHNIDALAARHRLLLPDLPRFGRSDKTDTDLPRLDFLSGAIGAFLRALDIERADLVGNSLGGQAAIKLAIDQPDVVGKLAVIGSNAVSRSVFAPMPSEGVRHISEYYQGDGPSIDKMRALLRTLVFDQTLITDALVEARYQASIDPEVVALNRSGHWGRQSLDGELGKLKASTLILWGQDDRASPIDAALTMLRLIPDARLCVFPRCGHWVQVERAAEFDRVVLDFLDA